MNGHEQQRLTDYVQAWHMEREKCPWDDLVCHLGDSPSNGWLTWSAKSEKLPTLRRGSGMYWHVSANRHMLLKELYSCMGFASFTELAQVARVPLFRVYQPGVPYRHLSQALGNSQHVGNIGIFAAAALACTVLKETKVSAT